MLPTASATRGATSAPSITPTTSSQFPFRLRCPSPPPPLERAPSPHLEGCLTPAGVRPPRTGPTQGRNRRSPASRLGSPLSGRALGRHLGPMQRLQHVQRHEPVGLKVHKKFDERPGVLPLVGSPDRLDPTGSGVPHSAHH